MKEILTITITFDSDGGHPVPKQILYRGEKVKEPQGIMLKNGYLGVCVGWYTDIYYLGFGDDDKYYVSSEVKDANGNGLASRIYEEKSKRYDFDSVPSRDMVLHAGWENQK
jgi:hypothetical protein